MNKITFICPIYNTFPEIVSSCINQTHKNWELLLIHDGPNSTNLKQLIDIIGDNRIKFIETEERKQLWGHPIRKWALENIDILSPNTEYVVITNGDNFHVPHFCEYLLKGFDKPNTLATYCSKMVHSYLIPQPDGIYNYGIIETKLELGYIDCAGVLMKKEIAIERGWKDFTHSSDWTHFKRVIDKYGVKAWNRVNGCLLTHN